MHTSVFIFNLSKWTQSIKLIAEIPRIGVHSVILFMYYISYQAPVIYKCTGAFVGDYLLGIRNLNDLNTFTCTSVYNNVTAYLKQQHGCHLMIRNNDNDDDN